MRKVYPKKKDVALMLRALSVLPKDGDFEMGWRESIENKNPNFRFRALTNGIDWTVDVYAGHYYVARVGSRLHEALESIPSVVAYVARMLRIQIS